MKCACRADNLRVLAADGRKIGIEPLKTAADRADRTERGGGLRAGQIVRRLRERGGWDALDLDVDGAVAAVFVFQNLLVAAGGAVGFQPDLGTLVFAEEFCWQLGLAGRQDSDLLFDDAVAAEVGWHRQGGKIVQTRGK